MIPMQRPGNAGFYSAHRDKQYRMHRSRRRARLSSIYFALLMIQLINASMYLVPNACVLDEGCYEGPLVNWAGVSHEFRTMQKSRHLLFAVRGSDYRPPRVG